MGQMIYVATSGEYSSYGINGVFSSEELAWEAGERVEYYVLDEEDDVYGPWYVEMTRGGETSYTFQGKEHDLRVFRDSRPAGVGWIFRDSCREGEEGYPRTGVFTVWARTREQAIKAANEQRAQKIALGYWDSDEATHFPAVQTPEKEE